MWRTSQRLVLLRWRNNGQKQQYVDRLRCGAGSDGWAAQIFGPRVNVATASADFGMSKIRECAHVGSDAAGTCLYRSSRR